MKCVEAMNAKSDPSEEAPRFLLQLRIRKTKTIRISETTVTMTAITALMTIIPILTILRILTILTIQTTLTTLTRRRRIRRITISGPLGSRLGDVFLVPTPYSYHLNVLQLLRKDVHSEERKGGSGHIGKAAASGTYS